MSDIAVGQVWEDNDKRQSGRKLRVVEVGECYVVLENIVSHKRTTVHPKRMKPNSTGYRLLSNHEAQSVPK